MCKFSPNGFNVFFHLFLPLLSSSLKTYTTIHSPSILRVFRFRCNDSMNRRNQHHQLFVRNFDFFSSFLFLTKLVWCVCKRIVWKQSVTLLFSIFVDSSNVVVMAIYSSQTSHISVFHGSSSSFFEAKEN